MSLNNTPEDKVKGNKVSMMKLGTYIFSVDTASYQNLDRTTSWRWEAQNRVDNFPAYQYLGPGEDTITIKGVIYPHYKGGIGQLDAMRKEAGQGQPLTMTSGLGDVHGKWVIKQIQETASVFETNGGARKVEFSMQLARYGEDK